MKTLKPTICKRALWELYYELKYQRDELSSDQHNYYNSVKHLISSNVIHRNTLLHNRGRLVELNNALKRIKIKIRS